MKIKSTIDLFVQGLVLEVMKDYGFSNADGSSMTEGEFFEFMNELFLESDFDKIVNYAEIMLDNKFHKKDN